MAVSFTNDLKFFANVSQPAKVLAEKLVAKNLKVEILFQALKHITMTGKVFMQTLPVSTTAVMKGAVPPGEFPKLVASVETFLSQVCDHYAIHYMEVQLSAPWTPTFTPPPPNKSLKFGPDGVVDQLIGMDLSPDPSKPGSFFVAAETTKIDLSSIPPAKIKEYVAEWKKKYPSTMAEIIPAGNVAPPVFVDGQSPGGPVKLITATMLNQPVMGSSGGSIYRVFAISKTMKMACRLKGGSLSVRAEGQLTPKEISALAELGFVNHDKYMSCHYTLGDIPPERVLGVILFNPHLVFEQKITSFSQVSNGN